MTVQRSLCCLVFGTVSGRMELIRRIIGCRGYWNNAEVGCTGFLVTGTNCDIGDVIC